MACHQSAVEAHRRTFAGNIVFNEEGDMSDQTAVDEQMELQTEEELDEAPRRASRNS
jgi:plasmid stability protein